MLLATFAAQKAIATVRKHRRRTDNGQPIGWLGRKLLRCRHELWSWLSGTDIALGATIGTNLMLPHPNGVIIHEKSVIGDDCMIMQQVTLGQLAVAHAPLVGCGVYIGAGAKVLGNIKIGDKAAIGANAVVLSDVPDGTRAVGIPARLLPKKDEHVQAND